MKKNYITPAVEITLAKAQQMMAVSFAVSEDETSTQLGKEESAAWDIWEGQE